MNQSKTSWNDQEFQIIEEIKKERIQKLGQNRRVLTGFLFLTQPEDKIEAPESQDKELWNGVDEEYKKWRMNFWKKELN